jgi:hypothetical protein
MVAEDGDLALLAPVEGNFWRATLDVTLGQDGRFPLWHVPSGPLPLMPDGVGDAVGVIEDPFAGWRHLRFGDGLPFFGSPPGLLWLNLRVGARQSGNTLGLSSLEWIGNYFAALGDVAPEVTKKRWSRLRSRFSKLGPRVPRGAIDRDRKPEVFALPDALAMLREGAKADTFSG